MTSRKPWTARLITLFPEMFPGPLAYSLAGKALAENIWAYKTIDLKTFGEGRHRTVDGTPAGGGPGMILRADIAAKAIDHVLEDEAAKGQPVIYLSPRGKVLDQPMVRRFKEAGGLTMLCGRFEGLDERLLEARDVEEVSIGDYVLSGGEPAALVLMDAVIRLLPGVVGDANVLERESFESGLLEHPHYTKPQEWEGRKIPEVLLSGHHGEIEAWRKRTAEDITRARRPDLWNRHVAEKDENKNGDA